MLKHILNTVILIEHSDKPQVIISCLGCQQKLEVGQTYVGFKNEEPKEFVVTSIFTESFGNFML